MTHYVIFIHILSPFSHHAKEMKPGAISGGYAVMLIVSLLTCALLPAGTGAAPATPVKPHQAVEPVLQSGANLLSKSSCDPQLPVACDSNWKVSKGEF